MPTPKQIRILVVDDDEATRYGVSRSLRRAGYHVIEASTGKDGLREIEKRPDLIIMDVRLPDMNGLDISRSVRHNPVTSSIPILQMSATFTQSTDKIKGLDAGADGYLAHPVEPDELLANVRMLLRLRNMQDALALSNSQLKSVLTNIAEIYIAFDRQFRFVDLNPAAEKLLQRSADDLRGKELVAEIPQAREGMILKQAEKAIREGQMMHFEGELVIRPGLWCEGHVYAHEDRVEVYRRDITERKVAENKVVQVAAELEARVKELQTTQQQLASARDDLSLRNELLESRVRERTAELENTINDLETFSYSITHDMRAPLRAMQGFSKVLLEDHSEQLDAEGISVLHRIANAANRLDLLIRDVLSYGNIIRSHLTLVPVDFDRLVRDIVREYPGFQSPHAEIELPDKLPPVLGNEAFLTQCFSNLLGNAIKFVAPGTIPRIAVSAEQHEGLVRFKIKDNGIGIPAKHQDQLFKLFRRAQNRYPGTGIGLAVVRKAVERMEGRLGLESKLGEGSIFWFELRAV
jgi:PAS domain S-box-containing protein